MSTASRRLVAASGVVFLGALAAQCSAPKPATPPSAGVQLIGGDTNMKPIVSVKELMENMIDPIADNIFDAVWTDITKKGITEYRPRNDADWAKVKVGAVTLAEGVYLLKIPRP